MTRQCNRVPVPDAHGRLDGLVFRSAAADGLEGGDDDDDDDDDGERAREEQELFRLTTICKPCSIARSIASLTSISGFSSELRINFSCRHTYSRAGGALRCLVVASHARHGGLPN